MMPRHAYLDYCDVHCAVAFIFNAFVINLMNGLYKYKTLFV